jgi:hypothetical protein
VSTVLEGRRPEVITHEMSLEYGVPAETMWGTYVSGVERITKQGRLARCRGAGVVVLSSLFFDLLISILFLIQTLEATVLCLGFTGGSSGRIRKKKFTRLDRR